MPYFHIWSGLRGCYMPNTSYVYMPNTSYVMRANTRRELREAIADEARDFRNGGYVGANERAISHIAAMAWKARKRWQLPYALPLAPPHARTHYCEGVFISSATRAEYLEYLESEGGF